MTFFRILLLALGLTMSASAAETPEPPTPTATLFARYYPLTLGVLAADFPQDLRALEQGFAEIDSTEISPQLKLERAFLTLTALRKSYAPKLAHARTELSALMVLSLADFYRSVMRQQEPTICGTFATDGAATLLTLGQGAAYARELDRQGVAYFSAVASALEDPDVVGPASEADWTLVMSQIVADGHPPSYIASIAGAKATDPDLCPALLALFQALVEVKTDVAQRVRAEFIQGVTGY